MNRTVGTCGACGGRVAVPAAWLGLHPPVPACEACGRQAARPWGPVVETAGPAGAPAPRPRGWIGDWAGSRPVRSGPAGGEGEDQRHRRSCYFEDFNRSPIRDNGGDGQGQTGDGEPGQVVCGAWCACGHLVTDHDMRPGGGGRCLGGTDDGGCLCVGALAGAPSALPAPRQAAVGEPGGEGA